MTCRGCLALSESNATMSADVNANAMCYRMFEKERDKIARGIERELVSFEKR
jgi:hypothetical protein